jgi:hypothetical protein
MPMSAGLMVPCSGTFVHFARTFPDNRDLWLPAAKRRSPQDMLSHEEVDQPVENRVTQAALRYQRLACLVPGRGKSEETGERRPIGWYAGLLAAESEA